MLLKSWIGKSIICSFYFIISNLNYEGTINGYDITLDINKKTYKGKLIKE